MDLAIDRAHPSPNHGPRAPGARVEMLVLHYTGMTSGPAALARMTAAQAGVSAHYMVDEDGAIFALVPEDRRAWHAGESSWRGGGDVNSRSIGVEIVNPGHAHGYRPFPEAQMRAVVALCQGILTRWPGIAARNVAAHSDIAPTRKKDPGELFDWPRLARAGIGLFPSSQALARAAPSRDPARDLEAIGYETSEVGKTFLAFQRRFAPPALGRGACARTLGAITAVRALYEGVT